MPQPKIDPRILALCKQVTAKRARTVIDHILKHGHITTEELQETYSYDHPPRAARDVREAGIPLETFRMESTRTGRQIAAYRFADVSKIRAGRIGGRSAFSKSFKEALVARYGERDTVTGQSLEARYLQIDHRVPYEVHHDDAAEEASLDAYMLLDASTQRAKSWSCEHCKNWLGVRDVDVCRTCYWASPEKYTHVAMVETRRVDVRWDGQEVREFDRLSADAEAQGVTIQEHIKRHLERK